MRQGVRLTHFGSELELAPGLVASLYLCFATALALWLDLVFVHPDPGVVPCTLTLYQEVLTSVVTTATPPNQTKYCQTCLTKKPIRSKVS